ncbi:MAG: hypothetical protein KC438_08755, partial [Thermomicrobiales bacterium]|nr:hypothetical protein [Thermomicrobiales bacterium]
DGQIAIYDGVKIVGADVISDVNSLRHDPAKLSQVLVSLTRPTGSVTPLPVDRIEARTGEPLKI